MNLKNNSLLHRLPVIMLHALEFLSQVLLHTLLMHVNQCLNIFFAVAGSDVASIKVGVFTKLMQMYLIDIYIYFQTTAKRQGDDLIINGQKM